MRAKLIRIVGLAVAGACMLLGGAAPSAQAAKLVQQAESFNLTGTDPCTGASVTFTGTAHEVIEYTQDANGVVSGSAHINFANVHGSDPSGDKYVFVTTAEGSFSTSAASTATAKLHEAVISAGSAANYVVSELFHATINAKGVLIAWFDTPSMSCTG